MSLPVVETRVSSNVSPTGLTATAEGSCTVFLETSFFPTKEDNGKSACAVSWENLEVSKVAVTPEPVRILDANSSPCSIKV
jgi:hypothetical protein